MGGGGLAVGGVEAAKRAGYYGGVLARAGPYVQAGGIVVGLAGGYLAFSGSKEQAISQAGKPAHDYNETGGHQGLADGQYTLEDDLQENIDEIWPGYHGVVPEGP